MTNYAGKLSFIDFSKNCRDRAYPVSTTVFMSDRFRVPCSAELEARVWIDRIGSGTTPPSPSCFPKRLILRILGLYAVLLVEKGKGYFFSPVTGFIQISENEAVFLFPDIPHIYYPVGDAWKTRWVVRGGEESEIFVKHNLLKPEKPVFHDELNIVFGTDTALEKLMHKNDIVSVVRKKTILFNMLTSVLNFYYTVSSGQNKKNEDIIEKAIFYINNNLQRKILISDIAHYINLSETHFRRLFKRYTGISPKAYILREKIELAKEYLSIGKSIKETAMLTGYEDVFLFMRRFKKCTGYTAGKFVGKIIKTQ